jgi:hypothetical protein
MLNLTPDPIEIDGRTLSRSGYVASVERNLVLVAIEFRLKTRKFTPIKGFEAEIIVTDPSGGKLTAMLPRWIADVKHDHDSIFVSRDVAETAVKLGHSLASMMRVAPIAEEITC